MTTFFPCRKNAPVLPVFLLNHMFISGGASTLTALSRPLLAILSPKVITVSVAFGRPAVG